MVYIFTILITLASWMPLIFPDLLHDTLINSAPIHEYDRAYRCALAAVQSDPDNPEKLLTLGFMLKKLNRYPEAIALYEHARPFIAQRSKIERALSGAYLALGDFERGWSSYEYRWVNPPGFNEELRLYLAKGGSLQNKIVVLKTEYGLGDTLQFVRYAQLLKDKGARVILECQKQLIPLLSLCPYIDEIHPQGSVIPAHFFAMLMSMPLIMNCTLATIPSRIPYLYTDTTLMQSWSVYLNSKRSKPTLRIGICWQADTHQNSDNQTVVLDAQAKSIPLIDLARLTRLEHVQLYSLQKINGLEQLDAIKSQSPIHSLEDLDTIHGPFMDTAALMKNLDLVITIDTSIAHLAGGLGVPCWLMLNSAADWRWLSGVANYESTSPWYPNTRIFRQKKPGDWNAVIDEVITTLKKELK